MSLTTMDNCYLSKLLSIIEELSTDESKDLIFLCKNFISEKTSELQVLIDDLKKGGYIDQENIDLFAELLYYLKRFDLLHKYFHKQKEDMEKKLQIANVPKVPQFRLLLYELGGLVPDSEFNKIKNEFNDKIPKAKLDKMTSLLDVFLELEKRDVLHDLEYLKAKSIYFDDDFQKKLSEYEQNYTDKDQGEETDHSEAPEEFYNMNSQECGICLIINNFNFEKSIQNGSTQLQNRTGTEKDEESLNEVFSNLGFHVEVKNDLDGNEILNTIKSYSKENYENNDCFICCILSHGARGSIYGVDGKTVAIKDLTFCFQRGSCSSLNGKPKLFFIQACQGQQHQQCVTVEADACNACDNNMTNHDVLIPAEPDFLLGMATVSKYVSYRDTSNGSWYIQSLCNELKANYQRGEDILSILTKVNKQLSRNCTPDQTQMPEPRSTLSRKLVFKFKPSQCSNSSQSTTNFGV